MSTKLYNGLRLIDERASLVDVVGKIAAAIRPVYEDGARRIVAEEAVRVVDSAHLRAGHADEMLFLAAEEIWTEQQASFGPHAALHDPLRFSIVLGRASSGNVLVYPYYRGNTYTKALERTGLFTDYHFQNQTDRPGDISAKEWERRAADWESLTDDKDTFGSMPMWQLANSLRDVFSLGQVHTDVNEIITPDARLLSILSNTVSMLLIADGRHIMSAAQAVQRASRDFLVSECGQELARPERIPALTTGVSDLPPVFKPTEGSIRIVCERALQILENG
ncbi:hypothetical protein [Streptomyces sp. MMS24-I29]|uniref:hypothetical protein n=1 Tax=Streptomyces sp. MMS24-I29 TaxID=3351480 RepID=UPI003C7DAF43